MIVLTQFLPFQNTLDPMIMYSKRDLKDNIIVTSFNVAYLKKKKLVLMFYILQ